LAKDPTYLFMLLAAGIVFGAFGGVGVATNLVSAVFGYPEVRFRLRK